MCPATGAKSIFHFLPFFPITYFDLVSDIPEKLILVEKSPEDGHKTFQRSYISANFFTLSDLFEKQSWKKADKKLMFFPEVFPELYLKLSLKLPLKLTLKLTLKLPL